MGIDALGEYAARVIRFKAQQLIGRHGFTRSDREDIEQELRADLVKRLRQFDPARAKRKTFIARVIEHKVATIIEYCRAGMRDFRREERSLDTWVDVGEDGWNRFGNTLAEEDVCDVCGRPNLSREERSDLASDVENVIADLPAELRELCRFLKSGSLSDAARRAGIPRSTLYDVVRRIRERFEQADLQDYLPKRPSSRRQSQDGSGRYAEEGDERRTDR
jgi:RNA polymerase sigma-70 factor (ECF subfamily)